MDMPRQPPWDDEKNAVDLPAHFAPHEHWAWARIIRGEIAQMNRYPGPREGAFADFAKWLAGKDDGFGTDANATEAGEGTNDDRKETAPLKKWPDTRILSPSFMRLILFQAPYRNARSRPWVGIYAARFDEELIWTSESFGGELWLDACRFERDVRWRGLHIGQSLSLEGSHFAGELTADRLAVEGGLFCREEFTAKGEVSLGGGKIAGDASFVEARLGGALRAEGLIVGGSFYLRGMTRVGDVEFVSARITGDLQLSDSTIEGTFNFTGAHIDGELQTAQDDAPLIKWGANKRLILRNATLGALAGGVHTFPKPTKDNPAPMDLSGLTYARIGGLRADEGGSLAHATSKELRAWLAAGHPRQVFTPAPYQQLASALSKAGHAKTANDILYSMRAHEARCEPNWFRKFRLFWSDMFIGYGHRTWRAFAWFVTLVIGFAAFGMNIGHVLSPELWRPFEFSPAGWNEFLRWLGFSFGNSIPVVNIDKAHETFLAAQFGALNLNHEPDPASVPPPIAWAFYGQKVLGLVILSYLAAGLTGLAQRGGAGSASASS